MKPRLTVTELTRYLKTKLETDPLLMDIYLKGEISNFKRHTTGTFYFRLKDQEAQISSVMFSNYAKVLPFVPKDGDHVLVKCRINLYEPRGEYSINIYSMELDGIGQLYLEYEKLKKTLEMQGYFEPELKKAIPKFPKRIGVVTSKTGAVIEDIKNTVNRRYRLAEIVLFPTLVQGNGAKESISAMINYANEKDLVDVLIVGRGGGSIEDLWAFNELLVIEAIINSKIPIITAIGHETDFTISDFVSDLRAPTPTAAAELATPDSNELKNVIKNLRLRINTFYINKVETYQIKLAHLDRYLETMSPENILKNLFERQQRLKKALSKNYFDYLIQKHTYVALAKTQLISPQQRLNFLEREIKLLSNALTSSIHKQVKDKTTRFMSNKAKLELLSPLALMSRGYAVVKKSNKAISSIESVEIGDDITIILADGKILTKVSQKEGKNE